MKFQLDQTPVLIAVENMESINRTVRGTKYEPAHPQRREVDGNEPEPYKPSLVNRNQGGDGVKGGAGDRAEKAEAESERRDRTMKNLFEADAGFTPGPWTIHNNIGKKCELGILADKAPCIIAVICNREAWPSEAHANALLISQAPAMLENQTHLQLGLPSQKPCYGYRQKQKWKNVNTDCRKCKTPMPPQPKPECWRGALYALPLTITGYLCEKCGAWTI